MNRLNGEVIYCYRGVVPAVFYTQQVVGWSRTIPNRALKKATGDNPTIAPVIDTKII